VFRKKLHLNDFISSKKVLLKNADMLDAIAYDEYKIPVFNNEPLLVITQNKLKELEQLVGQVCHLNKEISNIIKK